MMKEYYEMITQAWSFFRTHYPPEPADAWYDQATNEARELWQKSGSVFLQELLVAVLRELNRINKACQAP